MSREANRKNSRRKRGATLMEVVIVIAIIAVVAAIAVPSAVGFFTTARSSEVEANARSVFLAAQDYLTNAKKNGMLPAVTAASTRLPGGVLPSTVENQADLYYMQISKDGTGESAAGYMQALLTQYLSDKALSDYTINVEYNCKTGNVFSASFSFDAAHFAYGGGASARTGEVELIDRSLETREALSFGHYGVDKNVSPAAGGELQQLTAELINGEALILRFSDAAPANNVNLPVTYSLAFKGGTGDVAMTLMPADFKTEWTRGNVASISAAMETTVSVSTPDGAKDIPCWLYMARENGVKWYCLVLDSIDTSDPAAGKDYPEYSIWNRYPWLADKQISVEITASAEGYESVSDESNAEYSAFATPEEGYAGSDTLIENARHLNNIRYKTASGAYTQVADFGWDSAVANGYVINGAQIETDAAADKNALRTLNWSGDYNFTGVYASAAGSVHTIDGIHILRADGGENTGLFGTVAMMSADVRGAVRNLRVINASVSSETKGVGIIAGNNLGMIENVTVSGSVSGGSYTGGLVGINDLKDVANTALGNTTGGNIASCTNLGGSVAVTGEYAGGLIGMNYMRDPDGDGTPGFAGYTAGSEGGTLTVTAGGQFAGGVLGGNIINIGSNPAFTITASTVGAGSVTAGNGGGNAAGGGIVGASYVMNNKSPKAGDTTIGFGTTWANNNGRTTEYVNCTNTFSVSSTMFAGGIVGYSANSSDIYFNGCKNSGSVTLTGDRADNDSYIGGMTGRLPEASGGNRGLAENCENSGVIDGRKSNNVGGIVGWSRGRIRNCKNTGDVISTGYNVGGIVGYIRSGNNSVSIENCKNGVCTITGSYNVGGFVGRYELSDKAQTTIADFVNNANVNSTDTTITTDTSGGRGKGGTGGVIGHLIKNTGSADVTVSKCQNTGTIYSMSDAAGGVIGRAEPAVSITLTISKCGNFGAVGAKVQSAGGVIGLLMNNEIAATVYVADCTSGDAGRPDNIYDMRGTGRWFGGIIGYIRGSNARMAVTVSGCKNHSNILSGATTQVGGIIGRDSKSDTVITNCENLGAITGAGQEVGGIVGYGWASKISDCTQSGSVDGAASVGGIAGSAKGGTAYLAEISNCTNNGPVGAGNISMAQLEKTGTGGIIGYMEFRTEIVKCTNNGDIGNAGSQNVGGIAGCAYLNSDSSQDTKIENGKNTAKVMGLRNVGGIIGCVEKFATKAGSTTFTVTGCTNNGTVAGSLSTATNTGRVGGIVGLMDNAGNTNGTIYVTFCTNAGTVSATKTATDTDTSQGVGGIVGWSSGGSKAVVQYNTMSGLVQAGDCNAVGGIVGVNEGRIISCCTATPTDWDAEHITGYQRVGGIAGDNRQVEGGAATGSIESGGAADYITTNVLNVRGHSMVGGVVGRNGLGAVSRTYNTGRVTALAEGEKRAGGIVGYKTDAASTVTKSVSRGSFAGYAATPTNCIGGVVGRVDGNDLTVTDCYSYGDNVPETDVGGAVQARDFGSVAGSVIAPPPTVDWDWTDDDYIKRWIAS